MCEDTSLENEKKLAKDIVDSMKQKREARGGKVNW